MERNERQPVVWSHFNAWMAILLVLALAACNFTRPGITPAATAASASPAAPDVPAASPDAPQETAAPVETPPQVTEPQVTAPQPPLDPGELTVVYTRAGELWRWQDGEAVRLAAADAYYPRISPDGQRIAFLRSAGTFHQELWAVNIDGSNERKLVSVSDLDRIGGGVRDPSALAIIPYYEYRWLPGTRRLAFSTQQVFNGPGAGLMNDLHFVDADTGQITDLFLSGWGGEFVFSPDGQQVAVVQTDKIILSNIDGSNYRPVMNYTPVASYTEAPFYARPHWSPDGDFLRVAIPPADSLAAPDQPTALWRIPVDGTPPVQEGAVTPVFFVDAPVTYSPDLARIAFIREAGAADANLRELHLATFDGGGDWAYASGPMLLFAGWSPDSRRFIYIVGEEQEMFLGSLDAAPQPLSTELAGAFGVRWVDAQRLLYVLPRENAFELALFDIDSGRSVSLDLLSGSRPVFDWIAP